MSADAQKKPTPIQPNFANFPAELKLLSNWVLWRYLPPKSNGGKWRKVPFQPNGKTASTTDRTTWNRFEECCAAYAQSRFDGVGFVFDGEIGADELCYCGVDFDACVRDGTNVDSLALKRIRALNTYTEWSVSRTGFHCILRAGPLDRIVKFDGVEIYTEARFFTFTGRAVGEIKAAAAEVRALVDEVRAKEAAAKQQQQLGRSGSDAVSSTELTNPFNNAKPAQAFAALDLRDSLSDGIKTTPWFEALSPERKDEVVDYALGMIAKNTRLLELEKDGGNNAQYYKLTVSVARSGAPNAEDIFVKHASSAKNADSNETLRQYFSRCRESQPSGNREITVGTLLHLAQQHGANFDQWKCPTPCVPALPPVTWSAAELKVSFSNIPHRQWLYGTYLIRGEITVVAAPGGAGKTALATGMAVEIATSKTLLGEKIWGGDNLKVLFINAEDSGIEIVRRVWAFSLAHAHRIAGQNLNRLYVAGADDARVQRLSFLRTIDRNVSALDPSGFELLESALDELRPDVLILDPLVAFCGGGNMNDNAVMSLVMQELKRLAADFNCAVLVLHHTRKGGDLGNPEAISGAAATVNLSRRAIMPVPMTSEEADRLKVLPSQRYRYFKVVDAKSNLAPRSDESPWYELHSVELPNPEPPTYPFGDNVQAVARVTLPLVDNASVTADDQKIRRAILDLVERGKVIDGQSYPYSPNVTGAKNERALLDDAIVAVTKATAPQQWHPGDLQAVVKRAIETLKSDKWLVEGEKIKGPRFRRGSTLSVDWSRTPWANERDVAAPSPEASNNSADEAWEGDGGQWSMAW
jgi:AAA domain